ncbi:MAG: ABC transporter permease [Candidatus Caldatribacteriota bacterium]|nr:ABC transporter permease [Candidatus Caldatribacteriota bacterium]
MRMQAMAAIIKKDIKSISDNIQIWLPLIILPLVFVIIIPTVLIILAKTQNMSAVNGIDLILKTLDKLPAHMEVHTFSDINQKILFLVLNSMFIPFFLMIPAMISSTTAACSFAGEKEKKTLESLLYAPISEKDLFAAKILGPFIASTAVTIFCFICYGVVVDVLTYDLFGKLIFPRLNWLIVVFWLSPILSIFAIFFNVYISARVKGFQEAYQLGALIVLPIVVLLYSQLTGLLLLNNIILFLFGLVLLIVSTILIVKTGKSFTRNKLFLSQIK